MCNCTEDISGTLCCHEKHVMQTLNGIGLGLVADHRRKISDGSAYDRYFPTAAIEDKIVINDGTVKDTVQLMESVVEKYNWQTKAISKIFKRDTLPETLDAIWTFLYKHVQYKLDKPNVEELRTPARSWHDGQMLTRNPVTEPESGIDCDCFSIFVSSILTNLGIKHKFRITKYGAGWQHVYVVVPVPGGHGEYWVIDCVLNRFNFEKRYTDKFDYTMETLGIPVAILSGTEDTELHSILSGADFDEPGFGATADPDAVLGSVYNHLVRTRNYIAKNPHSVLFAGGAPNHMKMLNHAIHHWHKPTRTAALNTLAKAEHDWNVQVGLCGPDEYDENGDSLDGIDDESEDEVNGLGKTKGKKKFWNTVKAVNKKVIEAHKKVGQKIIDAHKKLFKAVVRYNPLTATARGGFILVLRENWWGFSKALLPGYLSESEARSKGYTTEQWQAAKRALPGVLKIFVNILQGKDSVFEKNVRHGAARTPKISFLRGVDPQDETLGEPYTAAASVTAASSSLIGAAKVMAKAGLKAAGNKDFVSAVLNFFKKHKDQIKAIASGGVTKLKEMRDKKKNKKSGSDDSSDNGGAKEGTEVEGGPTPEEATGIKSQQKEGGGAGVEKGDPADEGKLSNSNARKAAASPEGDGGGSDGAGEGENNGGSGNGTPEGGDKKTINDTRFRQLVKKSATDVEKKQKQQSDIEETPGFFEKVGTWVKENPVKTTIGVVTVATAITLAVSPKARKGVASLFKKKSKNGLSGTRRKKAATNKKGRKSNRVKQAKHIKKVHLK